MKELKIQNQFLSQVYSFLNEVELAGKASRGRSQLMKRLQEKFKEYVDDMNEIKKDYFLTENNELVVDDHGEHTWLPHTSESDKALLNHELEEIGEEVASISFTEYSNKYEALFKALEDYDQPLKGEQANAYDLLLDAYENNQEKKEVEENE